MQEETQQQIGLMSADLASWSEWRERCALGLCSVRAQEELKSFAGVHFGRYARKYAYRTSSTDAEAAMSESDAWHLFEAYLAIRMNRQGKRYKEWLFARRADADDAAGALLAGASLLMRDVTREHLRRECSPDGMISLSTPVGGTVGEALTIEDLLPGSIDPSDEVAQREFEALAAEYAQEFVEAMEQREKVVVLAKELGLSAAHPAVEKAAGCRKSVVSETYRAVFVRLALRLKALYPDEDAESVRILVLMAMAEVNRSVRDWGASQSECAFLFSLAEAQ